MKVQRTLWSLVALLAISGACVFTQGCSQKPATAPPTTQESIEPFLGRWDITVKTPKQEFPSWLELSQTNGELKGTMVGRTGSAFSLPKVDIANGTLSFTSQRPYTAKVEDGQLVGTTTGPDGTPWTWTGVKAPALVTEAAPTWGKPVSLFNKRNLDGWHDFTVDGSKPTKQWKVEHGMLVSPGHGPELVSDKSFENFKLHVEFKIGPDSNSGIYLRGRYEVQIETDSANESSLHHTGAIYGFIAPNPEQPRIANKWQTFDITLVGRKVTVVQNGKTIIDDQEIPGITGGALNSNEGEPGPIVLQGSEKGHVSFRNIVITPAVQ